MLSLTVELLSGRSCELRVSEDLTAAQVAKLAAQHLDAPVSQLFAQSRALNSRQSLRQLGVQDGERLAGHCSQMRLLSGFEALRSAGDAWFLAVPQAKDAFLLMQSDGSISAWGGAACSEEFCERLHGITQLGATPHGAFASLQADGSVTTWGIAAAGGSKSHVQDQLQHVVAMQAAGSAFAALKGDGSVVCWGGRERKCNLGQDCSQVQEELYEVRHLRATESAFAALRADGAVVCWGNSCEGGDCTRAGDLRNVVALRATRRAFAAIKADGSVATWGLVECGGGSFLVQDQLQDVVEVCATAGAFAALKGDGSVVCWGDPAMGGRCEFELTEVRSLSASRGAFAALKRDGSVVAWGDGQCGGLVPTEFSARLKQVVELVPAALGFAARTVHGQVVCWGEIVPNAEVTATLTGVLEVRANLGAFAALKEDETLVTWGKSEWGGDSSAVQHQLTRVVEVCATAKAFAARTTEGVVVAWGAGTHGGVQPRLIAQLQRNAG
ncbi:unnamed protein product [Effrenium voratum]|uniref:Ubiquitin-like domain-containing protein n=1 Tax=Effrenium voratum TaxID=2562239 RepID=A0AA36MTM3_9DINO|nr:unnamed protein product [Effrenium voratum]